MANRLNSLISAETAQAMKGLRRRYETTAEALRMAIGIAGVVVDAWEHGWPVFVERPNGTYRIDEVRNANRAPNSRVLSPVKPVFVPPRRGR